MVILALLQQRILDVPFVNEWYVMTGNLHDPCQRKKVMKNHDKSNIQSEIIPPGDQPLIGVPKPVMVLVIALLVAYFVPPLVWSDWDGRSGFFFSFIPARLSGNLIIPQQPGSAYWSMLTYAFLHGSIFHLTVNSLWLVVFGTPVARCLGGPRFFALAALASIAGALASLVVHWGQYIELIGASGAVSGMLSAAIPVMYGRGASQNFRSRAPREYFSVLPFADLLQNYRALWFMAIWMFFTLFTGASQLILPTALIAETQIAWEAHLGGFIAGLVAIYLFAPRRV
jgi:membrane associated rhomboid family serine protease